MPIEMLINYGLKPPFSPQFSVDPTMHVILYMFTKLFMVFGAEHFIFCE